MEPQPQNTPKEKQKQKKSKSLSVNLVNCKYDIIKTVFDEYRYSQSVHASEWSVFWTDTGVSQERTLAMKLSRFARLFPKEYSFFPRSWTLPNELDEFLHFKHKKGQCFISKPDHGCQGKGIFLFKDPKEIEKDPKERQDMVVQTYIASPLLINGYKFDLRVYVLVTSVSPLRLFVYRDGLARFATEPYQQPNMKNMKHTCMHLTNYAINKNSQSFDRDNEKGSKRSISSVFSELEDTKGVDIEKCWKRIHDVIVKTILIAQPQLSKLSKPWFPSDTNTSFNVHGSQCFEILGFDILLDSKLKPWVLEVNHSPSFACDSPLDRKIKHGVVKEALGLLALNSGVQKRYEKDQKIKSLSRLLKSPAPLTDVKRRKELDSVESSTTLVNDVEKDALESYHEKYNPLLLKKLTRWEDARLVNYVRVFPPSDPNTLESYLKLTQENSQTSTNASKARNAFRESKEQGEVARQKRMAEWKTKQKLKTQHIRPKVSSFQDDVSESPTVSLRAMTPRRSEHVKQLHESMAKRSAKVSISIPIHNMSFSMNGGSGSGMAKLERLDTFLEVNPIIKSKQHELNVIRSTVNLRGRRSRPDLA